MSVYSRRQLAQGLFDAEKEVEEFRAELAKVTAQRDALLLRLNAAAEFIEAGRSGDELVSEIMEIARGRRNVAEWRKPRSPIALCCAADQDKEEG